jgi:hypothetical protein
VIEIMRFRLMPEAGREDFLAADKRLQSDFAYRQPGLLRRTTAEGDEGQWIVIDLWASIEDADRCAVRWKADPVAQDFMGLVDPSSVVVERFFDLGG